VTGPGDGGAWVGRRALVLGASGFIGRWTAALLAAEGADLVLAGRDADAVRAALEPFADRAPAGAPPEIRAVDLARPGAAEELVAEVRPAIVFNLVGYGVDPCERDEARYERLNHGLVHELVYAIRDARDRGEDAWTGQHLIHAGSALEFGGVSGDLSDPWHCRPTTSYGRTKLRGSEEVVGAVQRNDLRGVSVRLFTVFGPGEHAGRLLPALLAARRADGDLELTAGTQLRDFTYVEDAARGLLRLGAMEHVVAESALNLATGKLTPVREFAETAGHLLGIAPERLKFGALETRPEEMSHDPVSTARLAELTGWVPDTSIADGVRRTLEFPAR